MVLILGFACIRFEPNTQCNTGVNGLVLIGLSSLDRRGVGELTCEPGRQRACRLGIGRLVLPKPAQCRHRVTNFRTDASARGLHQVLGLFKDRIAREPGAGDLREGKDQQTGSCLGMAAVVELAQPFLEPQLQIAPHARLLRIDQGLAA